MSSEVPERRPPSRCSPSILLISALLSAFSAACSLPFNSDLYNLASRRALTHVAGVSLNATALSIGYAGTFQMTATVTPANATNKNVTWSSSNTSLATVSSTGLVTAASTSGTVNITVVTEEGGFTDTCAVTVTLGIPVTGVSLNTTTLTLLPGETSTLAATIAPSTATNQSVTWSSNNVVAATVSTSGLVTGIASGTATITVTTVDGSFTATCTVTVPSWQPPAGGGLSSGGSTYSGATMALDSTGVPYIAFKDASGKGVVEKFVSGAWSAVGGAGFASAVTVNTTDADIALALDSSNNPYVAFQDPLSGGKVTVMEFIAGAWTTVGSAGFSTGVATYISLTVDGTTPYVSYVDAGLTTKVSAQAFNGSSWVAVGTLGFSNSSSTYTSVGVRSGAAYIAYENSASHNPQIVTGTAGGGSVSVFGGTFGSSNGISGAYTSLAIDPATGSLYVAFQDSTQGSRASVYKTTSPTSSSAIGSGFTPGAASYTSIAVAPDSSVYVAFQDAANGNRATVMKYTGTSWITVISAGFSAGQADNTTLKIDSAGHLFVSYDTSGSIFVQELQ